MPSLVTSLAAARAAQRLPLARLVLLAELVMLAKAHFERLSPAERRRLVLLVREARGAPGSLPERKRHELAGLVAKIEPKVFAREAASRWFSR